MFYWYGENKDGPTYIAFSLRFAPSSRPPLVCLRTSWHRAERAGLQTTEQRSGWQRRQVIRLRPARRSRLACVRGSGSPARVDIIGVSCYSSRDLVTWRNEGAARSMPPCVLTF